LKLEDIYVKPEHRKKGIGKAFFAELGKIAREQVPPIPIPESIVSLEFSLFCR
jgi:hypothetical protein